jgi:hypothetical protein
MRRFSRAGQIAIIAGLVGACRTVVPNRPEASGSGPDATAQAGAAAAPRSGLLDPNWVVPGTDTMLMSRGGDIHPVSTIPSAGRVVLGMTIETVRRRTVAGGRAVLDVSFEERDTVGRVARTTIVVDGNTLLPIRQRAELDAGEVVNLIYTGSHLLGIDSAPGRPPRYFSTPVPDTMYSSGAIDVLLRALPLAHGFRASLPLYFPADDFAEPLPVRVVGEERITTRAGRSADCWLVAADFPGGITEHFWIEESSHAILRILAHDGETSLVRYDR